MILLITLMKCLFIEVLDVFFLITFLRSVLSLECLVGYAAQYLFLRVIFAFLAKHICGEFLNYVEHKLLRKQGQIILLKKEANHGKMTSFCPQNGSNGNQGSPKENNANIAHITSLPTVLADGAWEAGGFPSRAAGLGLWPTPVIAQLCHREPVCPNPAGLVLTNLTVLQNNSSSKPRLSGRKGSFF